MRSERFLPIAFAIGVSMIPARAMATSTTCSTSVVCAEYINTSSGVAIHGEADTGIGIRGTSVGNTGSYGASGSGLTLDPGVDGETTNHTGNDVAGAFGLSALTGTAPGMGVVAYGTQMGVFGETHAAGSSTTIGYGVFGVDSANTFPDSDYNVGVVGRSSFGTGVLGESNTTPTLGLIGEEPIGVYAAATTYDPDFVGIGLEAESPQLAIEAQSTLNHTAVDIATNNPDGHVYIDGYSTNGTTTNGIGYFSIGTDGNETLSGTLTTSKGIYVATQGGSGAVRTAYGARMTIPALEDVGEARMIDGRAAVAIDPALADSIDMRRPYHVFVTPEGESNELYVTQKTPSGFVVREAHGGHATIAFEYRIVAKPRDEDGQRLTAMRLTPPASPTRLHARTHPSAAMSPEDRLRRSIGPAAYAKSLAALRARFAGK